jgi:hypothetical protein
MKSVVKLIAKPKDEFQHQENVINWSLIHRDEYPELALLHSVPNGGSRNKIEAVNLKRTGLKPGVPDLDLPVARGRYHGLRIEMKDDEGTESAKQIWWREKLTEQGYFSTVCHGWESACRAIEWYLNLKDGQP